VKSEHLARLTLIGIGAKERGNDIKEFKVLNKINQKQKNKQNKQTKQTNKNLSMKENKNTDSEAGPDLPLSAPNASKI
jgi:hypothetical protein